MKSLASEPGLIYAFTKYIYSFMKFVLNGPNSKFVSNYYALNLSYSLRNLLTMNGKLPHQKQFTSQLKTTLSVAWLQLPNLSITFQ